MTLDAPKQHVRRFLALAGLFFALTSALTGCGSTIQPVEDTSDVQGAAIEGKVFGGQQPIIGAHVYLMQANAGDFKGPSTSLLTKGTQDSSGNYYVTTVAPGGTFSITGDYTCTANTQVYLVGTGGNSGGTSTTVSNSAIVQVALLGNCPSSGSFASSVPYITLNELTTVAAAYAVAGFAQDYMHIGAWADTEQTLGLANAFTGAGNIVSLESGAALANTPGGNGTVPTTKLNTLADIIASCVNTSSNTSTACTNVFNATPNAAGTTPTTTFDAALNLAQNPTVNSTNSGLINQATAVSPFYPYLATTPNDWTISVQYSVPNAAANQPGRPDVDASGNVWIPNEGNNSLTEVSPLGVVLSGSAGYTGGALNEPFALAVNQVSSQVWVANFNADVASVFSTGGTASPANGYTTGNAANFSVEGEGSNVVFGGRNGVAKLSNTGARLSNVNATTYNSDVAIDPNAGTWTAQYFGNSVATIPYNSTTSATYTAGGVTAASSVATDFYGNMWAPSINTSNDTVAELAYAGTADTGSPFSGAGLLGAADVKVDGYNRPWISNSNGTISAFTTTGAAFSGSTGYTTPSTASYNAAPNSQTNGFGSYAMLGLVIDQAGNLWAPDRDGNLYEFLGLTTPPVPVIHVLQIACGAPANTTYTTSTGKWVSDATYVNTGNVAYTEPNSPTVTYAYNNVNPAPAAVYLNEEVNKSYNKSLIETIPNLTAGGTYTVNLHFAEIYYSNAKARQFNVLINGTQVLTNFDIYAQAGGMNIGLTRSFTATADNNGTITITFAHGAYDNPKCEGIEIVRK